LRIDAQHLALVAHVGDCAVRLVLERGLVLKGQKEASRGRPARRRLLVGNDHLVPARDAAKLLHLCRRRVDRGDGYPLCRRRIEISCVLGLQLGYLALPTLPSRCSERAAGRARGVVQAPRRTPVCGSRAQRARTPNAQVDSHTRWRAHECTHTDTTHSARARHCQQDTHARCARQRRPRSLVRPAGSRQADTRSCRPSSRQRRPRALPYTPGQPLLAASGGATPRRHGAALMSLSEACKPKH
jgi:hypothetical protein